MNDITFTNKVKAWFDSEHTDDNIREGAMLLLQITNNRHLYQQIMMRPQHNLKKLQYELNKHLKYRMKGLSLDEVRKFDEVVTPVLQAAVDKAEQADIEAAADIPHLPVTEAEITDSFGPSAIIARGKRADHDQLPENIQQIWDANAALWKKSKSTLKLARRSTRLAIATRVSMQQTRTSARCLSLLRRSTMPTSRAWKCMIMPARLMPRYSRKRSSLMLPSPQSR